MYEMTASNIQLDYQDKLYNSIKGKNQLGFGNVNKAINIHQNDKFLLNIDFN